MLVFMPSALIVELPHKSMNTDPKNTNPMDEEEELG